MEPTSEPENRQPRGLARFWSGHGTPTPAPGRSDEDPDVNQDDAAAAHASDQPAGVAGPTGEHPQVSDQQSQPHDDQQEPDEQPAPFAPRPHPALTSDTEMVALGSRRPADALLGGTNGTRWSNQGGFPPAETNGYRNGDVGPRHGGAPVVNGGVPGPRPPFAPAGDEQSPSGSPFGSFGYPAAAGGSGVPDVPGIPAEEATRSAFLPAADEAARPGFLPLGDEASRSGAGAAGADEVPGPRSPFAPASGDSPAGVRPPFGPSDISGPPGARSPFAPADGDGPAGASFAPSPFAPRAATGSASVAGAHPDQPVARPVSATPSATGSAQVPVPMGGRPVSAPPAGTPDAPAAEAPNRLEPTRLEPTGWATAGPRPGASGSAAVPVSSPGGGRRSRDDEDTDERVTPARRRSSDPDDPHEAPSGRRAARSGSGTRPASGTGAAPATGSAAGSGSGGAALRPGDVNDIAITFWAESAGERFRGEWHEVKAQFVDDPEAALARAHDLLTQAVHELTEAMLAECDELDPLHGTAKPDTESMRMAMRGYREFLDRILAL